MAVDRDFLHKQINTIVDDLVALTKTAPSDRAKINSLLDQIADNAKGLRIELQPLEKLKDHKLDGNNPVFDHAVLNDSLAQINPGTDAGIGLDDFLGKVGKSLVAAQTDLNERSRTYSQNVLTQFKGLFPPAQFLIPHVKAEMTVGVNEVSEHTVNLIFIKDSETKSNFVESKISFDLSAAPPPPGATIDLNTFAVLQGKLGFLAEVEKLDGVSTAINLANTKHFAFVFAVPKESAPDQDINVFLALYLIQDQDKPVLNEDWKTMIAVAVQRVNDKLQLYNKLFEGDTNPAIFPKSKAKAAIPYLAFGDALMQIVASLYVWSSSLGFPPEAS
jgi:hypothetical protein